MNQLLRITLDAIGRVTANHEYRLKVLEGHRPQAESCASDCSADGRRIKQGEASVQPAGPEQTQEDLIPFLDRMYVEFSQWTTESGDAPQDEPFAEIISLLLKARRTIEGEAGGGQDDRSRPAG